MIRDYNFIGTHQKDDMLGHFYSKGRCFSITKIKDNSTQSFNYFLMDRGTAKGQPIAQLTEIDKQPETRARGGLIRTSQPKKQRFFNFEYKEKKYMIIHSEDIVRITNI
jgi:hypothetical protein